MIVWTSRQNMHDHATALRRQGQSIGFVPTMGALHQGHLSLVQHSLRDNDATMVSIFVNPTQFDNPDDLAKYPRFVEKDLHALEQLDKNIIVYLPLAEDIYQGRVEADHYDFGGLEKVMEGAFRPGHFDGVATIVRKLFDIVQPHRAYFGEKDFQQLRIIQTLAQQLKDSIEIVPVEIYRENDGLAMSSRNLRLTPEHRGAAPFLYESLQKAREMAREGLPPAAIKEAIRSMYDQHPLLDLEYFEIADEENLQPATAFEPGKKYRGFLAVYAGDIRLIDNMALN